MSTSVKRLFFYTYKYHTFVNNKCLKFTSLLGIGT